MRKIIVADTSCLILLLKIKEIDLLKKLFEEITITEEVQNELQSPLPDFIKVKNPKNKDIQVILESFVDKGEQAQLLLLLKIKIHS